MGRANGTVTGKARKAAVVGKVHNWRGWHLRDPVRTAPQIKLIAGDEIEKQLRNIGL
jgi:hypothetical protein